MSSPLFVLAVASLAFGPPQGDKPKDIDKLQGSWVVSSMEAGGREIPRPPGGEKLMMVFDKDTIRLIGPKAAEAGKADPAAPSFRFDLDEGQSPRTMDIELLTGPQKGEKGVGIYQFKGEELWLLMPGGSNAGPPPKEFKTTPESKHVLMKLKRDSEKNKEK